MDSTRRNALFCYILAVATTTLFASPVAAQQYPSKPIRLIVPLSAGGAGDLLGRIVAEGLAEYLKQPVIVDNRAGANGIIGMQAVVSAPPDGYTLLFASTGNIAINPGMYGPKLPFDTEKDLLAITEVAEASQVLTVHPSFPATSVRELIDLAKAKPGKYDYVSAGNGSTTHLNFAMFASMAGIDLVPITFRGANPGQLAQLAGQVPILMDSFLHALENVKAGKVRALGVASPKRSPLLPDVPAIAETVPGYAAMAWYGIFAPVGTSREIVSKLHDATLAVLRNPEIKARLARQGTDVVGNTPAEFSAYIKTEVVKWTKVVKETGVKGE